MAFDFTVTPIINDGSKAKGICIRITVGKADLKRRTASDHVIFAIA